MADSTSTTSSMRRSISTSSVDFDDFVDFDDDFDDESFADSESLSSVANVQALAQRNIPHPNPPGMPFYPPGLSGVGGVAVHLTDPNPVPTNAQVQVNHSDFQVRVQALGGAGRSVEMDKNVEQRAAAVFEKTKAYIVDHINMVGNTQFTAQQIKMQINYTTQIAIYEDPGTKKIHTIDLTDQKLKNKQEVEKEMQLFMNLVPGGGRGLQQYESMIAGPVSGSTVFAGGVKGMGTTLEQFAKKDLKKLMNKAGAQDTTVEVNKRMQDMATVELYRRKLSKKLKELITAQETAIKTEKANQAPDQQKIKDLEGDLKLLRKRCRDLEGAHTEALFAFIALGGLENPPAGTTPTQEANRIQSSLRDYLVNDRHIDCEGLMGKKRVKAEHERFIAGVGALALPPIEDAYENESHRAVFAQYAQSKRIHASYGTGMEGSFLYARTAVHSVNNERARTSASASWQNPFQDRDDLISAGFNDPLIKAALGQEIAKTQTDVSNLHGKMDQIAQRQGMGTDRYIKEATALIQATS